MSESPQKPLTAAHLMFDLSLLGVDCSFSQGELDYVLVSLRWVHDEVRYSSDIALSEFLVRRHFLSFDWTLIHRIHTKLLQCPLPKVQDYLREVVWPFLRQESEVAQ